jgi:hypothetical protein
VGEVKYPPTLFRVNIMEYERGLGCKLDDVKYFDTEKSAKEFCTNFNSQNTSESVPSWYMVAEYIGQVS